MRQTRSFPDEMTPFQCLATEEYHPADNGQHQKHGAGDRVAAERVGHHEKGAGQCQKGEQVKEGVLHG